MAENNSNQRSQQESMGNQDSNLGNQRSEQNITEQNRGDRQEVSNEQSDRMESQPGNLSGAGQENQRSGNQSQSERSSELGSTENL